MEEVDEDSKRIMVLLTLILLVFFLPRNSDQPAPELKLKDPGTGVVPRPEGPKHRIARVAYRAPEASDLGRKMDLWGPSDMTRVLHLGLAEGQVWGSDDLLGDPAALAKSYQGVSLASSREADEAGREAQLRSGGDPSRRDVRHSLAGLEQGAIGVRETRTSSRADRYLLDPRIRGFRPSPSAGSQGSGGGGRSASLGGVSGSPGATAEESRSGSGSGELPPGPGQRTGRPLETLTASTAPGWRTWTPRPLQSETRSSRTPRDVLPRGDRR